MRKAFERLRERSRRGRYRHVEAWILAQEQTGCIIDLGGGPASFFAGMFPQPQRVVLVDIELRLVQEARRRQPSLHCVAADARRLPFARGCAQSIVCNSVIEHVDDPGALAAEIRRVGRSYFVQTPCGSFPLEMHSFIAIPLLHWLPWASVRQWLCRLFGADWRYVDSVHYLKEGELCHLFPEARVVRERALGLTKSFYIMHQEERAENRDDGNAGSPRRV